MTISLAQQIEEVEREIALRLRVYPALIKSRKMKKSVAEFHMERIRAVLTTLHDLDEKAAREYARALGQ